MPNPDGSPHDPTGRIRGGNGRFHRDPATITRDAQAATLRSQGHTYQQIADELGFGHKSDALTAVNRCINDIAREPAEAALHFELDRLDAQLLRLDKLEAATLKVLAARHITVNNGRVIIHPETGEPMEDDAPVLAAVDRLVKIEDTRRRNGERRARLLGLDAAVKVDATVHEVTQEDVELAELIREAKARTQAEEQQILDGGTDA